ncbi:hypothetical protein K1X12_13885 [Hyphomonas sp. WL0036]|uniref:hypothetical protein n=1 Tax=Hyphomonas sediminis TaxID=2866160 RepID=UPI001C827F20|nr:hypothetical protein [Hyphomonas sediminis]MBY9067997.1 hypothetical protein [Hyphomonas sediminis]
MFWVPVFVVGETGMTEGGGVTHPERSRRMDGRAVPRPGSSFDFAQDEPFEI